MQEILANKVLLVLGLFCSSVHSFIYRLRLEVQVVLAVV